MSRASSLPWLTVLMGIVLLASTMPTARAAPAPRVVVEMDGTSVVLVAADGHLSAYVDRIADNAPVKDAALGIELRGSGVQLDLRQVSPGLFVAPFVPSGRDSFLVTLGRSGNGRSQSVAELGRQDDAAATPADAVAPSRFGQLAWLLVGLIALGALAVLLSSRYLPGRRAWPAVGRHAS